MFRLEIPLEIKVYAAVSCMAGGLLLFWAFCRWMELSARYHWVKDRWRRVVEETRKIQERRLEAYRQAAGEYGSLEQIPRLQKWDRYFVQSGLQKKIPFLNSQLYLTGLLLGGAAGFGVFLLAGGKDPAAGMAKGVIWTALELSCGCMVIKVLRIRERKKTEGQLLPFLNMADNFSRADRDLFRILEKTGTYLKEPLKSALLECSSHASQTGNRYGAIQELVYRIEHPKFQEIIRNLDICSRNEANYSEVLQDMRESLLHYLSGCREEASILREGKIQILLILFMGMPMVGMLRMITGVPLLSMTGNLFGRLVIGYWMGLLLFVLYQLIFAEDRKDMV